MSNPFSSFFEKPRDLPSLPVTPNARMTNFFALPTANETLGQFTGQQDMFPQLQDFFNQANSIYQQSISGTDPTILGNISKFGRTNQSFLNGEIPSDVGSAIQRAGAQRGLTSGTGANSGINRNYTARDFGLTSLDLMSKGAQGIGTQLAYNNAVNPYQIGSALFSPQQIQQQSNQNISNLMNVDRFNAGQLTNNDNMAFQRATGQGQIDYANSLSSSPFDKLISSTFASGMSAPFNFFGNIGNMVGNLPNTFTSFFGGNPGIGSSPSGSMRPTQIANPGTPYGSFEENSYNPGQAQGGSPFGGGGGSPAMSLIMGLL